MKVLESCAAEPLKVAATALTVDSNRQLIARPLAPLKLMTPPVLAIRQADRCKADPEVKVNVPCWCRLICRS